MMGLFYVNYCRHGLAPIKQLLVNLDICVFHHAILDHYSRRIKM